jgi:membrane protease YdiL (CAAX protease family)
VLFALGHVLVDFNPQRLAVFFPALAFGWMRARTGSLAAGAVFHALCNLLADVLHASFFR